MRKYLSVFALIVILACSVQVAWAAGTFYLHDHDAYWWYIVEKPAFSAIIPAKADHYLETSIFGMDVLQMTFDKGSVLMELNYQPGTDVQAVKESVIARYNPLIKDKVVDSDREITTSNDLKAHFYAHEGKGANGKTAMLRAVFFQKENHVVYLTMLLDADKYKDDLREYWIRAVNGFEWN